MSVENQSCSARPLSQIRGASLLGQRDGSEESGPEFGHLVCQNDNLDAADTQKLLSRRNMIVILMITGHVIIILQERLHNVNITLISDTDLVVQSDCHTIIFQE